MDGNCRGKFRIDSECLLFSESIRNIFFFTRINSETHQSLGILFGARGSAAMPGLKIYQWRCGVWAILFALVVPTHFLIDFVLKGTLSDLSHGTFPQ